MDRDNFLNNVQRILPGASEQAVITWVEDAEECVQQEQYAYFKELPHDEAVSAWLDTLYATFFVTKLKSGQDAAEKMVMLSLEGMCMFPWELKRAADALGEGKTPRQIWELHEEGKLESDEGFLSQADIFWAMLERANELNGHDLDAAADWVKGQLIEAGPDTALAFHTIIHGYEHLSRKYGLWTAAVIMNDGCSDSSFDYFRPWLMYQGRATFMTALKDPDSLADVEPYNGCRFETLSYVGDYAYEQLTGTSAYDAADAYEAACHLDELLSRGIEYGEGIEYPYEWDEVQAYLPRLCAKYLTAEDLEFNMQDGEMWNHDLPDIQALRHETEPRYEADRMSFEEVVVFNNKVLFSVFRIDTDTIPKGLHLYEVRFSEEGDCGPCQISRSAECNFYGSIISSRPITLNAEGYRNIDSDKDWKRTNVAKDINSYLKDAQRERKKGHER